MGAQCRTPCAQYLRADELHTAFNFDFLLAPWQAEEMRASIVTSLDAHDLVGAPPTWVLLQPRHGQRCVSVRPPSGCSSAAQVTDLLDLPADFEVGLARARAAALLMLALPGGAYVYQGEEARPARGRGSPRRGIAGPHVGTVGPDRQGRRLPRADPLVGGRAAVRISPEGAGARPWLPQPHRWAALRSSRRPATTPRHLSSTAAR